MFSGILRLVPYSGVQTFDTTIPSSVLGTVLSKFIEASIDVGDLTEHVLLPLDEPSPPPSPPVTVPALAGEAAPPLARARPNAPASILHPITNRTVDPSQILEVDGHACIAHFSGRWLPVPYLRFVGRDEQQRAKFDAGPLNWVRIFIAPSSIQSDAGTAGETADVNITIAFDTSLLKQSRLDATAYLAPNLDDAAFGSTFFCAASVEYVSPFLAEPWLEAWLSHNSVSTAIDGPVVKHRHIAHYLTLLRVLDVAGVMPEARFTDTIQQRFPIRTTLVDLVLDIGDAETTALLVDVTPDTHTDAALEAGYAEPLRVRDLSEPHRIHTGAFPTTAEFTAAPFGDPRLSRDSGRVDAFEWPSLVRIGHEAKRLALRSNGTEGVTGLSNLRAFLLDDHASSGLWRQSTCDTATTDHGLGDPGPMVSGLVLSHVGENGTVIGSNQSDSGQFLLSDQRPAIRPRFSRASILGFFATELVLHALAQINSAAREGRDAHENDIRELRQVVVLAPGSLSPAEREALLARVDQGVALAWRGLGWDQPSPGVPKRPATTLALGGDLGTQIAFLHNEVTAKYQGRFRDLLRVYRGGDTKGATEALRVASVDFGARLTTLTVVDYAATETASVASDWQPSVQIQDRVPTGTDAALQSLIWVLLLPAIEQHLSQCGLNPARQFIDEITGRSSTSLLIDDPYFTRRFNRKVLWPAAQGLFALTQHGAQSLSYGNRSVPFGTLVELGGGRLVGTGPVFDMAALQAGARGFSLASIKINLHRGEVARIVRSELQECVDQVCRIVASNGCDLLLLGGDGTRLPPILDAVLAALPVPASRIIDLNSHNNRAANDALGGAHVTSAMLPSIASALDRRQLLDQSGFSHAALSRLALPAPSDVASTPRAIDPPQRTDTEARTLDRSGVGRVGAHPAKGG